MERLKEERVCSFCGDTSEDSFAQGKHVICVRCHYFGNVQLEKVPAGSIFCFKCNTYNQFRAVFPNGKVDFAYCADDSEGTPIYIPMKTEGSWNRQLVPTKLLCGNCEKEMPTFMMYLNTWTTPVAQ